MGGKGEGGERESGWGQSQQCHGWSRVVVIFEREREGEVVGVIVFVWGYGPKPSRSGRFCSVWVVSDWFLFQMHLDLVST